MPCIMWGNMISPGHVTQMGSTLDLLPTCCELAGVDLPSGVVYDGKSLVGVLRNSKEQSPRDEFYFYRGSLLYAVRKGKYKLHYMDKSAYGNDKIVFYDTPKLYDLSTDPEEQYDVANVHPEVVAEINRMVEKHRSSFSVAESIFDKRKDIKK